MLALADTGGHGDFPAGSQPDEAAILGIRHQHPRAYDSVAVRPEPPMWRIAAEAVDDVQVAIDEDDCATIGIDDRKLAFKRCIPQRDDSGRVDETGWPVVVVLRDNIAIGRDNFKMPSGPGELAYT